MGEIMTPFEVAAFLKIHVKTVYKLAEKGVIPGDRIGRSWRFSKRAILGQVSSRQKRWSGAIRGSSATKDFPKK
jgi:excisionase family DNA binding protein